MEVGVHLSGGNYFDDIRLDLPASYQKQDVWLASQGKIPRSIGSSAGLSRRTHQWLQRRGWWNPLVDSGFIRGWFEEFNLYWRAINGRPITVMDFHQLRFAYRVKFQSAKSLVWNSPQQHVANWQQPQNIYNTFSYVYRTALNPVRCELLPRLLKPDMMVLEYGCSVAPMYRTWRQFHQKIPTRWWLADIANFPFHFTRHVCARDEAASLYLIQADRFQDPLSGLGEKFDLIILQEVLEHVDQPRFLVEYLTQRLKPRGLLYFDYIRSEATGLDTPAGLVQRSSALEYIQQHFDIEHGHLPINGQSVGRCVARRKK